jgi:hypothetical protein
MILIENKERKRALWFVFGREFTFGLTFCCRPSVIAAQPFRDILGAELLNSFPKRVRATVLHRGGDGIIRRYGSTKFLLDPCVLRISGEITVFIEIGSVIVEFLGSIPVADVAGNLNCMRRDCCSTRS